MISSIVLVFLILVIPGTLRDQYKKAVDKYVEATLGAGILYESNKIPGYECYLFESEVKNDKSTVVFSTATGKFDNFDYMIIFNNSFEIMDIKILKYRSEYGYEIGNKGWLRQFYKKESTKFEYGKNIDALSGATFSGQALVNDVNAICALIRIPSIQ
jgi:Na+-translocating ferredoxin:NAD+ oxidoreductase RnfG subunit